jgi:hypothetical protein
MAVVSFGDQQTQNIAKPTANIRKFLLFALTFGSFYDIILVIIFLPPIDTDPAQTDELQIIYSLYRKMKL